MLCPHAARAQSNFNPYPIGERASGMGGAYTAIADDAAGTYYNPAGPAFAPNNQLALSTGLYGFVGGTYNGYLGQTLNFSFSNLNLIPSAANTLFHLGKHDGDLPSRWVLVINVFTPYSFSIDQRQSVQQGQSNVFAAIKDNVLFVGPSISYRASRKFSVGFGLYFIFNSYSARADISQVANAQNFVEAAIDTEATNYGLLAQLGFLYRPSEHWSFGLSIRSPSWTFAGSGTTFERGIVATNATGALQSNINIVSHDVSTQRVYPTQINVGLAWTSTRRLTLSADVQLYMPHAYDSLTDPMDPTRNVRIRNDFIANVALGLEYKTTERTALRTGFFTDLAANPAPDPAKPNESGADQAFLFGGTLAFGWVTPNTSTQLGIIASGGPVKAEGFDLQNSTFAARAIDGTEWRVFGSLSSSYKF